MVTIKKFGVLSVGIISGILSAIGGLFVGLWMLVWVPMMTSMMALSDVDYDFGAFGWIFGGISIILCPIIYGAFGFVGGIIAAALYNLFTKWVGGIKVELSNASTPAET